MHHNRPTTSTDGSSSWWVGSTQRTYEEFAARARAEQERMHVSKGTAFASTYDATMPRVKDMQKRRLGEMDW